MKIVKYLFAITSLLSVLSGCKKDAYDDVGFSKSINTPAKLKMLFDITHDNTGIVTITPNGESVATFDIYFGDGTTAPATVLSGKNVKHAYTEGIFHVRIVGHSVTGQTAEATQDLTVSFRAPENLVMTAIADAINTFKYNVSATALYATSFKVYFGDVPNEIPVPFLQGDIISHTYTASGTYTITVVALSGGAATATVTQTIVIAPAKKKQIDLPVTFDDPTYDYTVTDFGGTITIDAPDPINAANNVKKTTKPSGAATWAGTTLGNAPTVAPVGFYSKVPLTVANSKMTVKVYSPAASLHIRFKMEDHTNPTHTVETEALSTVANAWETLTFDFTVPTVPATATLNPSYTFDMGSIFFDLGNAGNGGVFYWDDVKFLGTTITPTNIALPLDFQLAPTAYVWTDFAGGTVTIENNPSATGINTSSAVGKMVKYAGQTYGGSFISLTNPIGFAPSNNMFKMKVFSPRVGAKVLLKVENKTNSALSYEKEVLTTVANSWELLTFDYSAIPLSNTYQNVILIFDNGIMGDGSTNYTFYFDDITLN